MTEIRSSGFSPAGAPSLSRAGAWRATASGAQAQPLLRDGAEEAWRLRQVQASKHHGPARLLGQLIEHMGGGPAAGQPGDFLDLRA